MTGNDVTWPQVTGSYPEVTSFDQKSPGSCCKRLKTRVYCECHFLQGCSSQGEAVTSQEMMPRDLRWPKVTRKWRHLIGSHLELAVEGRKLEYTVSFTSYEAVARIKRQSRDRKWRHMTSGDRKWPGSDVIWPDVTWNGVEKAENSRILWLWFPTRLYSHREAVTWKNRTWCDVRWLEVTLK